MEEELTLKVLLTGAAGFIGSFVAERLLKEGHEVVGLDNFDPFYDPAIKRHNIRKASESKQFELVEGDFRDVDSVNRLFEESSFDGVIHLGARAGVRPSLEKAPLYVDVNLVGTTNLLDAARHNGVERFVFASSSSVYGARPAEPFREDDDVDHPVSPYAATKRAGELVCWTYNHLFQLPITCLRFFTVYGPRQRPEMAIHYFTRAIDAGEPINVFGDGSAQRDFTYVDDIVDGIMASFDKCEKYHIYNLGGGQTVVLRDLISLIEKTVGKEAKINFLPAEPGDVPTTFADTSRSRAELGYAPKVTVEQGVPLFFEWYREHKATLQKA